MVSTKNGILKKKYIISHVCKRRAGLLLRLFADTLDNSLFNVEMKIVHEL